MSLFLTLFDLVFDKDLNIRPCGRSVTQSLISSAYMLRDDIDFGNIDTGFMNVDNIIKLYSEVV